MKNPKRENGKRANLSHIKPILKDLEERHAQGEPVYAIMAANIEARGNVPQIETDESLDETLWEDDSV